MATCASACEGMFPSAQTGDFQTLLLERGALHFKDVLADPDVPPSIRAIAEQLGIGSYSQVFAPMVWKGQTIGTLYVTRQPPTGFSDKEVELLRTFADQAVIAIQNSRLFNETQGGARAADRDRRGSARHQRARRPSRSRSSTPSPSAPCG